MRLSRKISIIIGVGFLLVVLTGRWLNDHYTVPILMYHKVEGGDVARPDTVSPAFLRYHMDYLKTHGYNVISLDDLVREKREGRRFGRRTVVLTFDDGEKSNYLHAVPILESKGFPATFFVSPDLMGKAGYLSWEETQAIVAKGFHIGSHGMTQAYLPDLSQDKQDFEIRRSREILQSRLGTDVKYIAYPVGGFDREVKEKVKAAGYQGAVTTNRGDDRFNKDVYELNRVRLSNKDNTDQILWGKLSGYYNLFRKLKPGD